MKFTIVPAIFCFVGAVLAVPTETAYSASLADLLSSDVANAQVNCTSANAPGSVKDGEGIVSYLHGLKNTVCTTNLRTSTGVWYAQYADYNNLRAIGLTPRKACGQVKIPCPTLGNYFETLIKRCEKHGKINAVEFLNPNQFELVHPKACKKNERTFAIALVAPKSS